jgi:hypothetical protein
MKKEIGLALLSIFILGAIFSNISYVTVCLSNTTEQTNITLSTIVNGNTNITTISQDTICQFGCDNSTQGVNQCKPDITQPTMFVLVPPIVLFILAFLMIYIAINMKNFQELQFVFFGMALLFMIVNAWYAQSQAMATLNTATGNVLSSVYYALVVLLVIVVFWFIISILKNSFMLKKQKRDGYGQS